MLRSLGRAHGDDSLLDLLTACHGRIRHFGAIAVALAQPAAAARPRAEIAEAAGAVRRYFEVALPLHAADEDDSLVPRLRGHSPAVDAALARMSAEHHAHRPLLARLCALTATLAAEPARVAELAAELGPLATELQAALAAHLALEEDVIFPAVAALPADDQAAVVRELRSRREN